VLRCSPRILFAYDLKKNFAILKRAKIVYHKNIYWPKPADAQILFAVLQSSQVRSKLLFALSIYCSEFTPEKVDYPFGFQRIKRTFAFAFSQGMFPVIMSDTFSLNTYRIGRAYNKLSFNCLV